MKITGIQQDKPSPKNTDKGGRFRTTYQLEAITGVVAEDI